MRSIAKSLVLVGALGIGAPTLLAQPQFKGMGKPPPGAFGPGGPTIGAIGDSGEVFGDTSGTPLVWSPTSGYKVLLGLDPPNVGVIDSCTLDVKVLSGRAQQDNRIVPVVWGALDQPPKALPGFPAGWTCYVSICSGDGKVVVGGISNLTTFENAIYIWRAGVRKNQGWEVITQFPPGMPYGGISDLSTLGTIGVGGGPDGTIEGFAGLRWTAKGGLKMVPDVAGGANNGILTACDASGFRASHFASPPGDDIVAAIWDPVNAWAVLGKIKPTHTGSAIRIDDTGFAGAGTSGFHAWDDRTGIFWNARDGLRSAQEVLVNDHNLAQASAWDLQDCIALSPNGRFIVGNGINPQGKNEAWWAEIRPFCYADCDNATSPNGKNAGPPVLDIDDFICYQTKFILGDYLYADCDLNGYLDINDFLCFQSLYAIGC